MMLPLSVVNQISAQSSGQVSTVIMPGQAEPDLTDEQQAGYDMELAALLLQLQPLAPVEHLPAMAGVPDSEITTQEIMLPDEGSILLSLPQQHLLQQTGESQFSQPFSLLASMFKTTEVAVLTPIQPQFASASASASASVVEVAVMNSLLNSAEFVPASSAGTPASQLSVVTSGVPVTTPALTAMGTLAPLSHTAAPGLSFLPEIPLVMVAAPENAGSPQTPTVLHISVPAVTAGFTTPERELLTAATMLEQLKVQMPPQPVKVSSTQSHALFTTTPQSQQQVVVSSPPVSHVMLATHLWNSQPGLESSQPSLQPSGVTPALASVSQVNYQWQSEPMPADPVRFGQRLLTLLSDKVDVQLGLGVNKAMIRLDPPSLGSIELAVQLDGEKLTVHLNSNNAQLKEAMQQGLEQLRASLQHRLGSDAQIDVRMGPDAHSKQQRDQDAQAQDEIAANIAGVEQAEDADTAPKTTMGLVNQLV